MLTTLIRITILYLIIIILFKVMGKRQIGEMQPFEFIITLIIADLATIPMADISIPLFNGIVPVFILVIIHFIITFFSRKSKKFSGLVSGNPVIVITPEGVDAKALTSLNISMEDLLELCRGKNVFNIEEVAYGIMETNGTFSTLLKDYAVPTTRKDMNITSTDNDKLQRFIIAEGKYDPKIMESEKVTKEYIVGLLSKNGIKNEKNVLFLAKINENEFLVQEKNKQMKRLSAVKSGGKNK